MYFEAGAIRADANVIIALTFGRLIFNEIIVNFDVFIKQIGGLFVLIRS